MFSPSASCRPTDTMNPPLSLSLGDGRAPPRGLVYKKMIPRLDSIPRIPSHVTLKEMEVISQIAMGFPLFHLSQKIGRNLSNFLTRINFSSVAALAPDSVMERRMIWINGALREKLLSLFSTGMWSISTVLLKQRLGAALTHVLFYSCTPKL